VDGNSVNWTNESSTSSAKQLTMEQRAEAIARNRAEEGDIAAQQPADRPGGVERPAAQLGSDRAVGIDDQIDQRFPTDDDHCVSSQIWLTMML